VRLASYRVGDGESYGAVVDGGIVDLARLLPQHATLRELIAADGLGAAHQAIVGAKPDFAAASVTLLPPIPAPEKIWCIGVNYAERNDEYKDASATPQYPSLFCRAPTSLVGHEQPIERPRVSKQLDYEGEIALVIGKRGRHIPRERALDYIFGLTLCNEGSVRDWLRHGKFNVTQGKNFDASGSIGPWMVTTDELDPSRDLHLTTKVNGELRQDTTTKMMMLSFADLIAYVTRFMTLKPGDIISTGTPVGSGMGFDPPKWLKAGDTVEITVPEIGTLKNTVVAES
jgi:2-keto-4-pentenoate hydratase/2-oxohepta-3-ene-1,7-dioic acid hydratase in catechol pathway